MKDYLNELLKKEITFIAYVLLMSSLVFLGIPFLRLVFFEGILVGDISYYHARMSHSLIANLWMSEDPLVKIPYSFNPYHLVLGGISQLIGMHWASFILPVILGVFSTIIFYFILRKLEINRLTIFITITLWILSPLSILTFSTSNSFALAIALLMLGFYLFLYDGVIALFFSAAIFLIMSFFEASLVIASIGCLVAYGMYRSEFARQAYLFSLTLLLFSLINNQFSRFYLVAKGVSLTELISDLGSLQGIGFFNIILAIIGFYVIWRIRKNLVPYLFIIASIVLVFYLPYLLFYLNIIISIFAAYGFTALAVMPWKLKPIKTFTILVILCSVIFSTVSYSNRLYQQEPNQDIINSLQFLNKNSDKSDTVLSAEKNSYWIQTVANRNTLLTPLKRDINITAKTKLLFNTRNLEKAKSMLNESSVDYIYITPDMRQGVVWIEEGQGIQFLFRNNETFQSVYNSGGYEIWKVLKQPNIS